MFSIETRYIFLHILEVIFFIIAGKKMSTSVTNTEYWKSSLWAFFAYFVVLGLRFGHNIDWNLYYLRYLDHIRMDWYTTEPGYHLFFYLCNIISLPYFLVISIQVIFLLYSFIRLVKPYRSNLAYIMPLFLVVAQSNDNYIRWYLGVSFVFLAMTYLSEDQKDIAKIALFCLLGVLFHNGILLLIIIVSILYFYREKLINSKLAVFGFLVSLFFISITAMSFLSDISLMLYFLGGDLFQDSSVGSYLVRMDEITSEGLRGTGIKTFQLMTKLITLLSVVPILLVGGKIMSNYKNGVLLYNLFAIGAFLNPFFGSIEIFDRYSKFLLMFQAIVAGSVFSEYLKQKYYKSFVIRILCILSLLCMWYPFYQYSFNRHYEYRMMYIWDAGSLDYIDPDYYRQDFANYNR